jgi:predicted tellurium resistance membrane protein TerC
MTGLELLLTPENAVTFLTLTFLEIVLAGDNLVLIAILSSKLPEGQRPLARRLGLFAAVATRILLLFSLFWLAHLQTPLALPGGGTVTPHQIVFFVGGAFLLVKALAELVEILFGHDDTDPRVKPAYQAFAWVILQIALFDIIFSLDSVIAAIGIAEHVEIMVAAVLTATAVMVFLVNPISTFIERHRIVKVAALDLLVVIGMFLIAESFGVELPRLELYATLAVVIALQSVLLLLRSLPRVLRYSLIIVATVGIAAVAVVLIDHPDLAQHVYDGALWTWREATRIVNQAADAVRPLLPKG